ncbi:hypothetical protein JOB18_003437 [Solea senegalensis]|uniref:Uncharacterized protein n=1 Tax=Solea senegalensis TaxID=28829 RepID=A0AAV6RWK7_SOLSE|nr:hypothetical protein JOB18_003437 [Solea senegalensis]
MSAFVIETDRVCSRGWRQALLCGSLLFYYNFPSACLLQIQWRHLGNHVSKISHNAAAGLVMKTHMWDVTEEGRDVLKRVSFHKDSGGRISNTENMNDMKSSRDHEWKRLS